LARTQTRISGFKPEQPICRFKDLVFLQVAGRLSRSKNETVQRTGNLPDHPGNAKTDCGFKTPDAIDSIMGTLPVINMLNTKYYIYDWNSPPLVNQHALGNAWFVQSVKLVDNADQEIKALDNFDPKTTAVVDKRFEKELSGFTSASGEGEIRLTQYDPNFLKYQASANNGTQLAVFSEIYYPKGWKAFIDGKEAEILQANYVLRALVVPQGTHEIEFRFEPRSYFVGNKISMASSILLLLAFAGYLYFEFKKK
jgi:hypothetical protein